MSKYLELAKKLKALADQGEGGERMNAEAKLKALMEKHGFTYDDLETNHVEQRKFVIPISEHRLFIQIAGTVLGKNFDLYGNRKHKSFLYMNTTVQQAIEIEGKFDFYKKKYKEELETFYIAFINANNLFPFDSEGHLMNELSEEECRKHKKAAQMAKLIDNHTYHKQIER